MITVATGTGGDYLQQTGAGGPNPISAFLPDPTGDFTIFLWFVNLMPAVVLPDYKLALALFTDAGWTPTDYAEPSVRVTLQQVDGGQYVTLEVFNAMGLVGQTTPVTNGVEKRAIAIRYTAATHVWELLVDRPTGWEISPGSVTSDFSGSPFTVMRALNDGFSSVGAMGVAYYRLWNGKLLTTDELDREWYSAVAITAGATVDTPLIVTSDLTDVSGGNSPWYATGSVTTTLPGPTGGDTAFFVCPEGTDTYVCAAQAAVTRIIPGP